MELISPNYLINLALLLVVGELPSIIEACFSFVGIVFLTAGVLFFTTHSSLSMESYNSTFKFL